MGEVGREGGRERGGAGRRGPARAGAGRRLVSLVCERAPPETGRAPASASPALPNTYPLHRVEPFDRAGQPGGGGGSHDRDVWRGRGEGCGEIANGGCERELMSRDPHTSLLKVRVFSPRSLPPGPTRLTRTRPCGPHGVGFTLPRVRETREREFAGRAAPPSLAAAAFRSLSLSRAPRPGRVGAPGGRPPCVPRTDHSTHWLQAWNRGVAPRRARVVRPRASPRPAAPPIGRRCAQPLALS